MREAAFGADPHDLSLYLIVAMVLLGSAIASGIGPIRRALRLEVIAALRVD